MMVARVWDEARKAGAGVGPCVSSAHKDATRYRLEKGSASVTMPHMNSRFLFPATLAAVGFACVALALAAARFGTTFGSYAL